MFEKEAGYLNAGKVRKEAKTVLKKFNDLLAILLGVVVIPGIWIMQGVGILSLPGEVLGATIAAETLIVQFYFRKAQGETS